MIRLKALIAGVGIPSHCEDVDISVSDPWNLQAQPSYLRELYGTDSNNIAHPKGFAYTDRIYLPLHVLHWHFTKLFCLVALIVFGKYRIKFLSPESTHTFEFFYFVIYLITLLVFQTKYRQSVTIGA